VLTPADAVPLPALLSPAHDASMEVVDLGFRYATSEPWVLRNCSFRIEAGESVAIVGASGCGKTTLLKLLLGLQQPTNGTVRIGGIDLQRLGPAQARAMFGVVMQDDQLFAGSIADNISFFDPDPDMARVHEAATLAAVHEDILDLPMGYHGLIGDMGSALSGGQKQRLILARALYRRPRFLFLDEATSHLDVGREQQVNAAVRRLKLTRVIIAHRPQTIASADRVLELAHGRIARCFRPPAAPELLAETAIA
jgi:ATP-binding cassette subfamily B protein RaxB